jgi:hypothetical protein
MKKRISPRPASVRRVERTLIERRGDTAIQVRVIEYAPAPTRPERRAA